jgi:hypothetical protein
MTEWQKRMKRIQPKASRISLTEKAYQRMIEKWPEETGLIERMFYQEKPGILPVVGAPRHYDKKLT